MLLNDAIAEFLIAQEADGSSASTINWYKSILGKFLQHLGNIEIKTISTADIRKYIIWARGEYAPDTAHAHIRVQHKFWKWCQAEYDLANPMRNIKYPDQPKQRQPKAIATEDIVRLFMATSDDIPGARDRAILALLADTGCRVGGIISVKVDDIDIEKQQMVVTEKGNRSRIVVFTPFTLEILARWLTVRSQAETLFYNLQSMQPLTPSGLQQILKRLKKKAGIKGRTNPHSFRHGFAREYLKAGGDLVTLQRLMGHAEISTTGSYYAIFTTEEIAEHHEEFSQIRHLKNAIDRRK